MLKTETIWATWAIPVDEGLGKKEWRQTEWDHLTGRIILAVISFIGLSEIATKGWRVSRTEKLWHSLLKYLNF